MKEIVLVSDNHGLKESMRRLMQIYPITDCFVHCGDSEMRPNEMEGWASVEGNNDFFNCYPKERVLEMEGHRILVVHGHRDMVLGHYSLLARKAKSLNCDLVFFGHTHRPFDETVDGIHLLNPGSIWRNRDLSDPSYMIVRIDGEKVSVERKIY